MADSPGCLAKPIQTELTGPRAGVFLHIFKCAGSSVGRALLPYSNLHVCHGPGFGRLRLVHGEMDYEYGSAVGQDLYRFTFIRNPFERFVSIWSAIRSRRHEGLSIDFAISVAERSGLWIDRRRHVASDHELWTHTRPISWYDTASCDFVGRVETFTDDMRRVCSDLGVSLPVCRINATGVGALYREILKPGHRARLESMYAEDLDRFDYCW